MSHSGAQITRHEVPAIVTAPPLAVPKIGKAVLWAFVVIGIATMLFVVTKDPKHAWTTFHVNFIYWMVLAAAASSFSAVFQIANAEWARPLRRIFESTADYFVFSLIPLAVLYLFGREYIFSWVHEPVKGKELWLIPEFAYLRDAVAIGVVAWLGRRIIGLSLRQDIGAIRSGLTGVAKSDLSRWEQKFYDRYVGAWGADPVKEIREARAMRGFLSPVLVMVFAFGMSVVIWDQVMAVDPHWFSTLFATFVFMSGVYMSMAWTSIGVGFLRELHPLFKKRIFPSTMHDLGKLLFGFGIFWAYLFWSHYLTFWYGNLPEETGWLITRARLEPWHCFGWMTLWCCFLFPFPFGLSKDVKMVPQLLFTAGLVVALGIWFLTYLLIVPTLYPHEIPLAFSDFLITLGFLGVFVLLSIRNLEKMPLIPFGDLYR